VRKYFFDNGEEIFVYEEALSITQSYRIDLGEEFTE